MYRFLCSDRRVLFGPYADDEIMAWLRGIRWCREVLGVENPLVVRAATRGHAQAKLTRR